MVTIREITHAPLAKRVFGARATWSDRVRVLTAGLVYVIAYVVCDWATDLYDQTGLGITLWNPPPALTLIMVGRYGFGCAPLALATAVLADVIVRGAPAPLPTLVLADGCLAGGYALLAAVLRRRLERHPMLDWEQTLLLILPVAGGTLAIASAHVGVLAADGHLPRSDLLPSIAHFWIGDLTGVLSVAPVLLQARGIAAAAKALSPRRLVLAVMAFSALTISLMAAVFAIDAAEDVQLFYLLFIPIAAAALRFGLSGAAAAILAVEAGIFVAVKGFEQGHAQFLSMQLFSVFAAVIGLTLGAMATARQRTQTELAASRRDITRAARLNTAGVVGMAFAHELSQPLAAVRTYAHVLRRMLDDVQDAQGAIVVQKIAAEAERAGIVLSRLRDLISLGQPRRERIELAVLIPRVMRLARDEEPIADIAVSLDLEDVPAIFGDSIQIELALLNLLRNAAEAVALAELGRRRITIRLRHEPDAAVIVVEDTGPGIGTHLAGRLFEPFITSKPNGLGLGLAICQTIAEAHGGEVCHTPGTEGGTQAVLRLPIGAASDG